MLPRCGTIETPNEVRKFMDHRGGEDVLEDWRFLLRTSSRVESSIAFPSGRLFD